MKAQDILQAVEGGPGYSGTHMHILGTTGAGKSFLLEYLLRDAILARRGFCFIDWHGSTYHRLLAFLSRYRPRNRQIVLLNPSQPHYVVGFNPFVGAGDEITTSVARRIDATVKPWGARDTKETPTLRRMAQMTYHFAAKVGETLPNTSLLLRYAHKYVADYATTVLTGPSDDEVREDIDELRRSRTEREWNDKILSTKNRLSRFIGHAGMQTFLGLRTGNINIRELVERDAIILVNLARSDYLHVEPAQVFASLLINEFREMALRRAGTKKHYYLALDEFQEYITFDVAAMLNETRKGGLHLLLAHQQLAQLKKDEELRDAVFTNARVKAVFGGLPYDSAAIMANELFLDRINERDIKETYYGQQVAGFDIREFPTESTVKSVSDITGEYESQARRAEGESTTQGAQRMAFPIYEQTVSSRAEWSREEKVSRLAAVLINQDVQHCTIRMHNKPPEQFPVPTLPDYGRPKPEYIESLHREANALTFNDAQLQVQNSREEFLQRARGRGRAKQQQKRTARSEPDVEPTIR